MFVIIELVGSSQREKAANKTRKEFFKIMNRKKSFFFTLMKACSTNVKNLGGLKYASYT